MKKDKKVIEWLKERIREAEFELHDAEMEHDYLVMAIEEYKETGKLFEDVEADYEAYAGDSKLCEVCRKK